MLCITHAAMDRHDPPGHPERPGRLGAAQAGVRVGAPACEQREGRPATREELERVHPAELLDAIDAACGAGTWIDPDTWAGPGSQLAYRLAAGCVVEGVAASLAGERGGVICLVRPPGHHAEPSRPMGFCLANNVAVGARAAQAAGLCRVAILDWDVHHGNGSEAVFREDPDVLTVSLHQWPLYPGTGAESTHAPSPGPNANLNLTFSSGTGPEAYLRRYEGEALPAIESFRPELLLISCGLDGHRQDPLGGLALRSLTFGQLASGAMEVARRVGAPAPVVVLEGGYDLGALERGMREVARALAADVSG